MEGAARVTTAIAPDPAFPRQAVGCPYSEAAGQVQWLALFIEQKWANGLGRRAEGGFTRPAAHQRSLLTSTGVQPRRPDKTQS